MSVVTESLPRLARLPRRAEIRRQLAEAREQARAARLGRAQVDAADERIGQHIEAMTQAVGRLDGRP